MPVRARQVPQILLAAAGLVQQKSLVLAGGRFHEGATLMPVPTWKLCHAASFLQVIMRHLLLRCRLHEGSTLVPVRARKVAEVLLAAACLVQELWTLLRHR